MQVDFHYAVIKCLAYKAGFSEAEAQIIAYASQYTDDATEWCGLKIDGAAKEFDGCFRNGLFEPTCTATMDIKSFTEDCQRKVFMSFHFLPGDEEVPPDYIVKAGGFMPEAMMRRVGDPIRKLFLSSPASPRVVLPSNLIRLGIAIHTYADTWSHQGWTGRREANNDVEGIGEFRNGVFHKFNWWERLRLGYLGVIPDIGHAEVLNLPDQAWREWGFTRGKKDIRVFNTTRFRDAAKNIYRWLRWCRGLEGTDGWEDISLDLYSIFHTANRGWNYTFDALHDVFGLALSYDKLEWRSAALTGEHVNWGGFDPKAFASLKQYKAGDDKWFWFHYWARDQRAWVMSWI